LGVQLCPRRLRISAGGSSDRAGSSVAWTLWSGACSTSVLRRLGTVTRSCPPQVHAGTRSRIRTPCLPTVLRKPAGVGLFGPLSTASPHTANGCGDFRLAGGRSAPHPAPSGCSVVNFCGTSVGGGRFADHGQVHRSELDSSDNERRGAYIHRVRKDHDGWVGDGCRTTCERREPLREHFIRQP
jgi:hypothetical protein